MGSEDSDSYKGGTKIELFKLIASQDTVSKDIGRVEGEGAQVDLKIAHENNEASYFSGHLSCDVCDCCEAHIDIELSTWMLNGYSGVVSDCGSCAKQFGFYANEETLPLMSSL